ncbi:MAG: hypothetical protein EOS63_29385 [Mesorhizobium sp.]|uniref:hypothetical protein n=1 Tax=Mesorhizobium sp. TaxID=1871066 RepID=UPI000FE5C5AB|nr:hypothetical protein [Mesorhizobium sp.]RWE72927.1 MAG: hypothetical protein EOS63_29385 [Mesorhizobium sp.]TJW62314.1 MAG: hypothetical protein E5V97_17475 [Mesorhizobium sp.]
MSDFAAITGAKVDAIRNAIRHNKLPFVDANRQNAETRDKLSRRTYSPADAFGWFLQERLSTALGFGSWGAANRLQSAWPRGLSWYIRDRFDGKPTGDIYLIFAEGLPTVDGIFTGLQERASHSVVGASAFAEDLRSRYAFVTSIHLDAIFDLFVKVTEARGWTVSADGFDEVPGNAGARARMLAREAENKGALS